MQAGGERRKRRKAKRYKRERENTRAPQAGIYGGRIKHIRWNWQSMNSIPNNKGAPLPHE